MTLVLIVKDLVFEGPTPKTKDRWVQGIYIHVHQTCCIPSLKAPWAPVFHQVGLLRASWPHSTGDGLDW